MPVFKYSPIKPEKPVLKQTVGPGYIKDLENAYSKEVDRKRSPKFAFNKAPATGTLNELTAITKSIPGVGHYKEVERAYTSNLVKARSRTPMITKSKMVRIS